MCRWFWFATSAALFAGCGGGGGGSSPPPEPPPPPPVVYAIQITSAPTEASVRVGQTAQSSLTWQFTSTAANPATTTYTVTSTTEGVAIDNASGSSLPNSSLRADLSYECATIETIEADLTIRVSNQTSTTTWTIHCTGQRITLEPLAQVVVSVGSEAESVLVWSYVSEGESPQELTYTVSSSVEALDLSPAEGSSLPDSNIDVALSYSCNEGGAVPVDLTVTVGSATETVTWNVFCSEETLTIETAPEPVALSVGETATATLNWRFASSWTEPRELPYAVSAPHANLAITRATGTAAPGTMQSHQLEFLCASRAVVEIVLQVNIGSASQEIIWSIECSTESIAIDEPPSPSFISEGETATQELVWRFATTGSRTSFAYQTIVDGVGIQVVGGEGVAEPNEAIAVGFEFMCATAGESSVDIAFVVGNAVENTTWFIECSKEEILLAAELPNTSVPIGQDASIELSWQFTTSGTRGEFEFMITSTQGALDIQPSAGLAQAGQQIETRLTYACSAQEVSTLPISISVGSASRSLEWTVACTKEQSISIVAQPMALETQIGTPVTAELVWTFESTLDGEEVAYQVTSSSARVHVGAREGTVVDGNTVTNSLRFVCTAPETDTVNLRIVAGDTEAEIAFQVICREESIAILSQPMPQSARVGESVRGELEWEFRSSIASSSVPFEVSATPSGVQLLNGDGTVRAGGAVTTTIRFACQSRRTVEITLKITAGTISRTVSWRVDCLGEDLTKLVATLFQGPEIATLDFVEEDGQWTHTVRDQIETGATRPIRFRPHRQIFAMLDIEHDEREPLPLAFRFHSRLVSHAAEQVGDVQTKHIADGDRRYSSRFVFDLAAEHFPGYGELRVQIDPDAKFLELDETNNLLRFELDAANTLVTPPFELKIVPIRTRDGTPDLSDLNRITQPIYELLPVSVIDASVTAPLDQSGETWSSDSGLSILEELYAYFLTTGDKSSFYHGVVTPGEDEETVLCGIAYIDSHVSVTVDWPERCAAEFIGHEVGHNLSLGHAPACGAELEEPDDLFPYPEGNIGKETGWLMKQRRFIDGTAPPEFIQLDYRYYDTMSYCPELFTSQYSYGKALQNIENRFATQASARDVAAATHGFERAENRSVVVSGRYSESSGWEIRKTAIVNLAARRFYADATDFDIRVVHAPSGTTLHEEAVHLLITHNAIDQAVWGVRIPYFHTNQLEFEIVDKHGQQLLTHAFNANASALPN